MFLSILNRRAILAIILLTASGLVNADDKYKLEEPVDDARIYGVGSRVDVKGKVQIVPKGPQFPQTVSAALSYRERRVLGPGTDAESFRSVREYETAEADINVDGTKSTNRLPDSLKLVIAQGRYDGVELWSLNGHLTEDELNLMRSPADSLAFISLLPTKEVAIGDKWTAPGWAFQMLTALDAVIKGELECKLDSVEKGVARVSIEGQLEGAAVGSMTEVKVSGHYTYQIEKKYISEVDFVQKETRAVGPVSPGLDLTARVRVIRQPGTTPGRLTDQKVVDAANAQTPDSARSLKFDSPWNISLQYGRDWHISKVEEKVCWFRLLNDGNFVAQCDMAPVPQAKPGTHLSEQVFLSDIRKSLGERVKSVTPGEVIPAPDRRFVFRVSADGQVGERQVTWIFYLVADASGRQLSMMFTVDTDLVDKLKGHDRELFDSLQFGPASAPRAAKTN